MTAEPRPVTTGEIDAADFRQFMSHWPTGVTVVTTRDGDAPVGCTVNAMMSVSLSPPLLVVSLAAASHTLAAVRRTGSFALNVLCAAQLELCRRFAGGPHRDRFTGVSYRYHLRLPVLADVVAAMVCTVVEARPCGDHVLVVGAPVWHTAREGGVPLIFHHRSYHSLP